MLIIDNENPVVSKCANPRCSARLKYMHDGSVFAVRKPTAGQECPTDDVSFRESVGTEVEWFWLCDHCLRQLSISSNGLLICTSPNQPPQTTFGTAVF